MKDPRKPSEADNIKACKQWLSANGYLWVRVNNQRMVRDKGGGFKHIPIDTNQVGCPDLIAWNGDYRLEAVFGPPEFCMCYAIEVKSWRGTQQDSQKEWQAKARKYGIKYCVVRSVEELQKQLIDR